jgi:hypothetical protein
MAPPRHFLAVFALLMSGLLCGCAGKRATVAGSVTFKGQSVDGGRIFFLPEGEPAGRPTVEGPIKQGKYSLPAAKGPELGRHRVAIVWHRKPGRHSAPAESGLVTDDMEQVIPAIYNSKTTLSAEIQRGNNRFDFDLKE